jgi:hypothetical protein
MGAPEERITEAGYDRQFTLMESIMNRIFGGPSESLLATDTCQFDDYSKYVASAFDVEAKVKRRELVFPLDCQKAYDMGARFAG